MLLQKQDFKKACKIIQLPMVEASDIEICSQIIEAYLEHQELPKHTVMNFRYVISGLYG